MSVQQAESLWQAVLGELQLHVTRPSYETWLKGTAGLDISDDALVIGTPNPQMGSFAVTSKPAKTQDGGLI